jgi:signal peptidase I
MAPTLNYGDLIIMTKKNPENILADKDNGDILIIRGPEYFYNRGFDPSFWNHLDNKTPIIHRAIDKKKINSTWHFLTKGDNNIAPDGSYAYLNKSNDYYLIEVNTSDGIFIPESEIVGVVLFKIPFIGFLNIYFIPILSFIIVLLLILFIFQIKHYKVRIVKDLKTQEEPKKLVLK